MAEMTRPKRREIILALIILSVLFTLIYLSRPLFFQKSITSQIGVSLSYPNSWNSLDSQTLLIVSDSQGPLITQDRPSNEETVHLNIAKVSKTQTSMVESVDAIKALYPDYSLGLSKLEIDNNSATKILVENLNLQFIVIEDSNSVYIVKAFVHQDVKGLEALYKKALLSKTLDAISFK